MKIAFAALTAFALSLAPAAAQETDDAAASEEAAPAAEQAEAPEPAEAAEPDEVETTLTTALEAYREGDIEMATEEVEYAQQLLARMKAERLVGFLPEPMEGWTMEQGDSGGMPGLGGMMASATYTGPENRVEVQIMAENQMVASMMMMFNNPVMMGQMGELKRIGRQKVVLTDDGELQAMLDNNVLVSITGDAPAEVKEEYFKRIDIRALEGF